MEKIGLGCDHGGLYLKEKIKEHLQAKGYEVVDFGTNTKESVDYPDFAQKVAKAVVDKQVDCGMVFCGTGIGISIAANKVKGIRCANLSDTYSATMCVSHNNCNMIALGGRTVGEEIAYTIVDAYLSAQFEGGRHQKRIDKITKIQDSQK